MPKVFNAFETPEVIKESPGERIEPVYVLDDSGPEPVLVQVGERDIYAEIQSYKDEVDINKIIDRAIYGNNPDLLNQRSGVYSDISDIPGDLAMMHHYAGSLMTYFDSMPEGLQAEFGGYSGFCDSLNDGSFATRFDAFSKKQQEVKADVNEKQS